MRIILVRHGTRDYGIGDRALNPEGLNEALELAQNPSLREATHLFSSPKKRAQMTLEPLSKTLEKPIKLDQQMDQHQTHEKEEEFSQRVKASIESFQSLIQPEQTFVLCSHSDWLAHALSHIPSNQLSPADHFFQCAEFMIFRLTDGIWILENS